MGEERIENAYGLGPIPRAAELRELFSIGHGGHDQRRRRANESDFDCWRCREGFGFVLGVGFLLQRKRKRKERGNEKEGLSETGKVKKVVERMGE